MRTKTLALTVITWLTLTATAFAQVTASGPVSLIHSPLWSKASSPEIGLFEFTVTQDAGESLSSVSIRINNAGASLISPSDFAAISVYKDNGDGIFSPAADLLSGIQTSVNIAADTTIQTTSNNAITGGKFFVALRTSSTWSDVPAVDMITVTFPSHGIVTSANSPAVIPVTTNVIIADTTRPTLLSVVAKNTGGSNAKEAGDSLEFTFSEPTNKPSLTSGNATTTLSVNNGHTLLNGDGALGAVAWNSSGTVLTLAFTGPGSPPTVAVGDVVAVLGSLIQDRAGNAVTGSTVITGTFGARHATSTATSTPGELRGPKKICANSLMNGRLYRINGSSQVYLAAACRLKEFKGHAVGRARGHKFQDIMSLPNTFPAPTHSMGTLKRGDSAMKIRGNKPL